jgi:hypothetical protein
MAHTNIGLGQNKQEGRRGASDDPGELTVDEIFAEDELDEHGAWCVDDGTAIQVMSTQQIRDAVSSGRLSSQLKTWRDGQACWLSISEQPELFDGHATPAPVVVDLDATANDATVEFAPPAIEQQQRQAAQAVRAGVLMSLALVATVSSLAWAAAVPARQPVMRARHLDLTVPAVTVGADSRTPALTWSPPFDPPMSGFRRHASR